LQKAYKSYAKAQQSSIQGKASVFQLKPCFLFEVIRMTTKVYYFAYGSNMDKEQMFERCRRRDILSEIALLQNYGFVYDGTSKTWGGHAVANVFPSPENTVWGIIYEVTAEELAKLDRKEGYCGDPAKRKYDRQELNVICKAGNLQKKAFVYLRTGQKEGSPCKLYRDKIIAAAKANDFPTEYIRKL